jgi:hypothetical protein
MIVSFDSVPNAVEKVSGLLRAGYVYLSRKSPQECLVNGANLTPETVPFIRQLQLE